MAEIEAGITHDMLVTFYDNGVTDGVSSGRMKGMDELREAFLYYLNMPVTEQYKVFGSNGIYSNLKNCSAAEFVKKINDYKELYEPKFKVGDYVCDCSNHVCVITNIDKSVHVMYPNGKTHKWSKNAKFSQTGRSSPLLSHELADLQEFKEVIE